MKIRNLRLLLIIIACLALLCACASQNSPAPDPTQDNSMPTPVPTPDVGIERESMPDFSVTLLEDGKSIYLSYLYDKPTILNFWATWCGPCGAEMPDFQEIYEEYGDSINMLAISMGETEADVRNFIEANGYTFPIGVDPNSVIATKYGISFVPQTFLLDTSGRLYAYYDGMIDKDSFIADLDDLLANG